VSLIEHWIAERGRTRYIAVTGMHGVTEAKNDAAFRRILNEADLVVPDGMPLVWLGRWRGYRLKRRVYGPELMATFCEQTCRGGYRHFLYGGAPGVAEGLAQLLARQFPGLEVVGHYSPPFRPLSEAEQTEVASLINQASPDVVWVGLSTPKQERWMSEFQKKLRVPVLIGVGAAFDFHAGRTRQAPEWMRENGFEWLYRLLSEPRRLWRRYLIYGSQFVWNVLLELVGVRVFNA
jgi:N-acetylglucosaminyldiphosphoundecaprenol N-acetyl-beta-D-mannosaminyltransferase